MPPIPDIEVTRIVNGDELLTAWRECRYRTPYPEAWPPYIEEGANTALIARSRKIGRKAVGAVTIKWTGPVRSQPKFTKYMDEAYPDELTPIVYALHVQKIHRRQGVGLALMEAVEKTVIQQPATPNRIALGVHVENEPAILLYSRLGYELEKMITVDIPKRHGKGFAHSIEKNWVMTKDLSELAKTSVK